MKRMTARRTGFGFGWTNAAFTELYAQTPAARRADVLNMRGVGRMGLPQAR
jgi:hypothetical protein